MKQANGGIQVPIPQPISKTMVDAALTTGGRPQTLVSRAQLWMNMSWGWNLASDDAYVYKLIQETYEMVIDLTKQRSLWDPYIFLNDAFIDAQCTEKLWNGLICEDEGGICEV